MKSEIELLQKWLINQNDKELTISANSRYGMLTQLREFVINKYGRDIYNEIITGKKVIKIKKIRVLSYKPELETFQIPFNEPEYSEPINYIKTEIDNPQIDNPQIDNWNEIVNSVLGTYWDYVYVKETIMKTAGQKESYSSTPWNNSITVPNIVDTEYNFGYIQIY